MNSYPDAVTRIVNDYLDRVKSRLQGVPVHEQSEFVMELQSHIYEAYQQISGEDDVARILAVLRNLGEPAEVVSDRLPGTMVRSGSKLKRPLYVLGGILIALFGLPLGAWGIGALLGVLSGLAGLLIAYYAVTATTFFVGGTFMLLGLVRISAPDIWDKLVALGFIQINGPVEFLNQLPPSVEGLLMIAAASVFIATGVGMLWLGKHMLRGLRFVFNLVSNKVRQLAKRTRTKLRQRRAGFAVPESVMEAK